MVAANLQAKLSSSTSSLSRVPPIVKGRIHSAGMVRIRGNKRAATHEQQAASKRARLTLVSGIPRTFLPQSLAMRFQTAIKPEPEIAYASSVPQSPEFS